MGIFSRKKPDPAPAPSGTLEERIARLERELRALDADMDELHQRFKRWTGRVAKQQAIDEPKPNGHDDIDPISRAILLQRLGGQ